MRIMQLLRIFREVARYRSFSRAAVVLGMTQSAASQRIAQLEKRLGVRLIDRSTRPLVLTEAGKIYQEGCRDILNRSDAMERRVVNLQPKLVGEVLVDAIYSAGIDLLNSIRAKFCQRHSSVRVCVEYKRPEEVHEAVRAGACDMGIVSFPQGWRDVSTTALRDEQMVIVCEPDHALSGYPSVPVATLNGVHMVAFDADLPIAKRMRQYFREHEVNPVVVNEFDNVDTMKAAVSLTHQVAVLPKRTVQRELGNGSLCGIGLKPPLIRPLGIIQAKRRVATELSKQGAIQAFIDFLVKHAGPDDTDVPICEEKQWTESGERAYAHGKRIGAGRPLDT